MNNGMHRDFMISIIFHKLGSFELAWEHVCLVMETWARIPIFEDLNG